MTGQGPHKNVELTRALNIVIEEAPHPQVENVGLVNSYGRVLASELRLAEGMPVKDTVSTDGFALRSKDTENASEKTPAKLSVVSESPNNVRIDVGTTVFCKKGDVLPQGADAIVERKHTYRPQGELQVHVMHPAKPGDNVRHAASEIEKGTTFAESGLTIGPKQMALAALCGKADLEVVKRPKVAVITTGADVVEVQEKSLPTNTRNFARYFIMGKLLDCGCDTGRVLHTREGRPGLERLIRESSENDAVIVCISDSDKHDIAVSALRNTGTLHFERIHIEPGAATAFATVDGTPVFVTSQKFVNVVFEMVIRPCLNRMLKRQRSLPVMLRGRIAQTKKLNPAYEYLICAQALFNGETYDVELVEPDISQREVYSQYNAIVHIPAGDERIAKGNLVDFAFID